MEMNAYELGFAAATSSFDKSANIGAAVTKTLRGLRNFGSTYGRVAKPTAATSVLPSILRRALIPAGAAAGYLSLRHSPRSGSARAAMPMMQTPPKPVANTGAVSLQDWYRSARPS